MARRPTVHLNLTKLARKVLAEPERVPKGEARMIPSTEEELLKLLQGERLTMTDYEFRRRYSPWL